MKKEEKLAFEYGRTAAESGGPFAVCDDPRMYELLRGTSGKPGIQINLENMRAWYMGYLTQAALAGNGISQELFSGGLVTIFDSQRELASIWIGFATGCVDLGQYVDFAECGDRAVEVDRWLETLFAGLVETQRQYGPGIAKQVCNLALLPNCLYPSEMLRAAEHLQNGGSPEAISAMIESGVLEGEQPFFPKLTDGIGEGHDHNNTGMNRPMLEM
ncbi:hypothetical protein [Ruminiclostridium cellobioparum]|uniref:hypothetical protein n=1 Tax=Ruminiclostridium cellobioparum TaxID=29355 RepID=UPI0028AF1677|nr:hypothetical protein [Ruminiclostridium cellobioparum]